MPQPSEAAYQDYSMLNSINREHLAWIERWVSSQPAIHGVPLFQALIYELMMVMNNVFINSQLMQETDEKGEVGHE